MSHTIPTRTRPAHPAARPSRAAAPPRIPRRVSGPLGGRDAEVLLRPRPVPTGAPRGRTGVFARLAVESVLDRVLRGRGWICFIALALGGIVFMQVWLLKLNTGISRAVQTTSTLERQNAELEASIARLAAGERIRRVAGGRGMVLPAAGEVAYVTVRPGYDEGKAATRMQAPTAESRARLVASRSVLATVDPGQAAPGQLATGQVGQTAAPQGDASPGVSPGAAGTPDAAAGQAATPGTATPGAVTGPGASAGSTTTAEATGAAAPGQGAGVAAGTEGATAPAPSPAGAGTAATGAAAPGPGAGTAPATTGG